MPFKSEAQHRKFRILLAKNKITRAKFDEYMDETKALHGKENPIKALPETVKKASIFKLHFMKVAGGPGSGVGYPNTESISFLETSPLISIGKRTEFMSDHEPIRKNVAIPIAKVKYKGQENMIPKKVVKMMLIWDKVKDNPIDVIQDDNGDFHIIDGHHRAIAAILKREKTIQANVYAVSVNMCEAKVASGDVEKEKKRISMLGLNAPLANSIDKNRKSEEKGDYSGRPEAFA